MLETIIRRKWYLQKHLDAPLLKERENYLAFMAEKRNYSHNYLLSLADYLLLIVTSLKLEDGFSEQVPISSIMTPPSHGQRQKEPSDEEKGQQSQQCSKIYGYCFFMACLHRQVRWHLYK